MLMARDHVQERDCKRRTLELRRDQPRDVPFLSTFATGRESEHQDNSPKFTDREDISILVGIACSIGRGGCRHFSPAGHILVTKAS